MNTKTSAAGVLIGVLGIAAVAVAQRATAPDPGLAAAESAVRRALPMTSHRPVVSA